MSQTNIDFSTKLLSLLSDKENSVISPYGIATVLAMAAEGADRNSLDEILTCLGFSSLDELRTAVASVSSNPCDAFRSENAITFVKGKNTAEMCEQFKKVLSSQYAAKIHEESSGEDTAVQLKNVSSFKAAWSVEMERDISGRIRFCNSDGSCCRPAFLKCTEELRYYQDDAFLPTVKAVALPYALAGCRIPYELVLVDSEKTINETLLCEILSNMQRDECEVEFPEFSIKSNYNLVPMMETLGIKDIFDLEKSSLSGIATEPLYAESFSQDAEIQVDKNGTVAIAITCMMMCLKGGISSPDKFCFNKPFSYFLRNTRTGEILFMGKVNKLSDCERRPSE